MVSKEQPNISLGFTEEKVHVGTHMCLIFSNENERVDALLKYLLSGLLAGERVASFSNKLTEQDVVGFLKQNNISYDERKSHNAIILAGTNEVYFQDGVFDPDRMLNTLSNYYTESLQMGFPASRVIGEMVPEVEHVPGGDRLLEYESRVSLLMRSHPVTAICQYDANAFDGATIMEILKVHPKMIVNGSVISNPFFVEPEEYLNERKND